jgi:hypothetical protein
MKNKAALNLLIWLIIAGLIAGLIQDQFCR